MPITATYTVRCDVCWGSLASDYDTEDDANAARKAEGWLDTGDTTRCPVHHSTASAMAA